MKKISIIFFIVFLPNCHEQKKSSFDKFFLIEYKWELIDIPEIELPRLRLISFVEYSNSSQSFNANRKNDNSPLEFHKVNMQNGLVDSLQRVTSIFSADKTFNSEPPSVYDGPEYAFLIVKKEKEVLICFLRNSLPQNLNSIFGISSFDAHNRHDLINSDTDTIALKTNFEKIIKERSKLLPPPVKTLKYVAPKVHSAMPSKK